MKSGIYLRFLGVAAIILVALITINHPWQEAVFHVSKPKPNVQKDRWLKGKVLFKENCSSCHAIMVDSLGPALYGATARWKAAGDFKGKTGEQWMRIWIRNWHDPIDAGYKYAINIRKSRAREMNTFAFITDDNISDIMLYVDSSKAY